MAKASGSTEGGLEKSRSSWILRLRKKKKKERKRSQVQHQKRTKDGHRVVSLWYGGRRQGKREISQSPGKSDNHQKDPFPNFDPGEKFPRLSAGMFGKPIRHTKIKYIQCGLLHFQNSNPLREKKGSYTTISADVKLNPRKTAIVFQSALSFNAVSIQSGKVRTACLCKHWTALTVSARKIRLILETGKVHSESTSSVSWGQDNMTWRRSQELGAIQVLDCLSSRAGRQVLRIIKWALTAKKLSCDTDFGVTEATVVMTKFRIYRKRNYFCTFMRRREISITLSGRHLKPP